MNTGILVKLDGSEDKTSLLCRHCARIYDYYEEDKYKGKALFDLGPCEIEIRVPAIGPYYKVEYVKCDNCKEIIDERDVRE